MSELKILASAIKQSRIAKGFSQEEFAEMLNVSATHIKHMESGHRKPSIEVLFMICKYTGLSIDKILYQKKENTNNIDSNLDLLIGLCSNEEKILITKLIEAVISSRNNEAT